MSNAIAIRWWALRDLADNGPCRAVDIARRLGVAHNTVRSRLVEEEAAGSIKAVIVPNPRTPAAIHGVPGYEITDQGRQSLSVVLAEVMLFTRAREIIVPLAVGQRVGLRRRNDALAPDSYTVQIPADIMRAIDVLAGKEPE